MRNALSWLVYSFRPLSLRELSAATALPASEHDTDVFSTCFVSSNILGDLNHSFGPLFELHRGEMRWRYPELREHFMHGCAEDKDQWFNIEPDAHGLIARVCASFLHRHASCTGIHNKCSATPPVDAPWARWPPHPLWDYVSTYWPQHFKCAASKERSAGAIAELIKQPILWTSWQRRLAAWPMAKGRLYGMSRTWLPLAAGLGLHDIITAAFEQGDQEVMDPQEIAISLLQAAEHGNATTLQAIAAHHRFDDESSLELLSRAALSGDPDTMALAVTLVTTDRSQHEWPPLVLCRLAQFGQEDTMNQVLDLGADPGATLDDDDQVTALYLAARHGQSAAVKCLTKHGAKVSKATRLMPQLPMEVACTSGDVKTVQALIEAETAELHDQMGVFTISSIASALLTATHCAFFEAVEALTSDISEPATIRPAVERALSICAELKHNKIARILLKTGLTQTSPGHQAIAEAFRKAVNSGNLSLCETLVLHDIDPLAICKTANLVQQAVRREDVAILRWLFDRGVNINDEGEDDVRATALHRAVTGRHFATTTFLLENGAEVNHATAQGWTPLLVAAKNGDRDIAAILIENGADLEQRNRIGWSPLLIAFDQEPVVRLLLERGADINATIDGDGASVLYLASSNDCVDTLRTLIIWKADLEIAHGSGHSPLTIAVLRNCTSAVRMLLNAGANIHHKTRTGNTVLHLAMMRSLFSDVAEQNPDDVIIKDLLEFAPPLDAMNNSGNVPVQVIGPQTPTSWMLRLVNRGANCDHHTEKGYSPLSYAVSSGNLPVVEFLLERKVSVKVATDEILSPLHFACSLPIKLEIVKALVEADVNVNSNHYTRGTPLQFLLRHCVKADSPQEHAAVAEYLIREAHADLNVRGRENGSALNAACGWSTPAMVRLLLSHGADVHIEDDAGRSAGLYAAIFGRQSLQMVMEAGGEELKCKDKFQRTLLHFAAAGGDPEVLNEVLLADRWDVDVRDVDGWTPLLWALRGWSRLEVPERSIDQQRAIVEKLVDAGADATVRGKGLGRSWTPLAVAHFHDRDASIIDCLEQISMDRRSDDKENLSDDESAEIPSKGNVRDDSTCDGCSFRVVGIKYRCKECTEYDLCYKCYISRHLVHPDHQFEEFGPEFADKNEASQSDEDIMQWTDSMPSSRPTSRSKRWSSVGADADSEAYVTANESD